MIKRKAIIQLYLKVDIFDYIDQIVKLKASLLNFTSKYFSY